MSAKAICESEILGTESFEQVAKALGEDASVSKIDEVIEVTTERVVSENKVLMRVFESHGQRSRCRRPAPERKQWADESSHVSAAEQNV